MLHFRLVLLTNTEALKAPFLDPPRSVWGGGWGEPKQGMEENRGGNARSVQKSGKGHDDCRGMEFTNRP